MTASPWLSGLGISRAIGSGNVRAAADAPVRQFQACTLRDPLDTQTDSDEQAIARRSLSSSGSTRIGSPVLESWIVTGPASSATTNTAPSGDDSMAQIRSNRRRN